MSKAKNSDPPTHVLETKVYTPESFAEDHAELYARLNKVELSVAIEILTTYVRDFLAVLSAGEKRRFPATSGSHFLKLDDGHFELLRDD